jgi:hypothetical protein
MKSIKRVTLKVISGTQFVRKKKRRHNKLNGLEIKFKPDGEKLKKFLI